MIRAFFISRPLHFKRPAGTSRGVLKQKDCWYIRLEENGSSGLGEVSFIPGLSVEDGEDMEIRLDHICKLISRGEMDPRQKLPTLPGVQFALETALMDLESGGRHVLWESDFTRGLSGIPTNGLIWMGDREYMLEQVQQKLDKGFKVLKMKVGALDFQEELKVLGSMREAFDEGDLEIRLDANGAWKAWEAGEKLDWLSGFGIHSIEQPLAPGQPEVMAGLCQQSLIPIALDEELIGISSPADSRALLETIRPQYIILKPGLLGGFSRTWEWILLAGECGVDWWATSALESNVGLSAIAQWTASQLSASGDTMRHQGLGTGSLYTNNIDSPLQMEGELLWYRPEKDWAPFTESLNNSDL